jgi:hypothetical protein
MSEVLHKINYELPVFLQECIKYSDLIHMVQLNDLKNHRFNHITFIGKFSEILNNQQENIFKMNQIIESKITSIYLEKKIDNEYLRPNHSIYNYKYQLVDNKDDILNGMLKCGSDAFGNETNPTGSGDFYILVNTKNEKDKYNVYAYTYEKSNNVSDCYYHCLVFIGKLVNVAPYKIEDVDFFEKANNLKLSNKLKNYLLTQPKICGLNNETGKKLFYINLFGNNQTLNNKFTNNVSSYNLEEFRPRLNKIWENQILDDNYKPEEDENYKKIIQDLEEFKNNFKNGFIEIGAIIDESFKQSPKEVDKQIKLFMLINADDDLQGTLWIYDLNKDPTGKNEEYIDYLPRESLTNIGCVCK